MDFLSNVLGPYWGVDWAAMGFTILSIYLLGKKNKMGFIYGFAANACWLVFGIMAGSTANVVANIIFFALNVKGLWNWHREESGS